MAELLEGPTVHFQDVNRQMSQCPCAVLVPLGKLVSSQPRKGQEEWKIPKRCASPSSAPVCGTVTREPCIPMRFPSFPVPELQLRTQAAAQRMGWRWGSKEEVGGCGNHKAHLFTVFTKRSLGAKYRFQGSTQSFQWISRG